MSQQIFFIIGAQRSGTTYLYNQLNSHPEIVMNQPVVPEPKYFLLDDKYIDRKEYLQCYFAGVEEGQLIGEKSTSYFEYPDSGRRILKLFPNAKFLVVLRNPVFRALSNYFFSKKHGLEHRTLHQVFLQSEEDAIQTLDTSVSPFAYKSRGNYFTYLEAYGKVVGRHNIKIFLFEDLIDNIQSFTDIYEYLNVDGSFMSPNIGQVANESQYTEAVSDEVLSILHAHFEPLNRQLADVYNLDLTRWRL